MKKKSLEVNVNDKDRKRRYSYAPMSSDESNTEEEVDKPGGLKRVKTARKLELEELTTSPVSGTIIRDLDREIPMPIHSLESFFPGWAAVLDKLGGEKGKRAVQPALSRGLVKQLLTLYCIFYIGITTYLNIQYLQYHYHNRLWQSIVVKKRDNSYDF